MPASELIQAESLGDLLYVLLVQTGVGCAVLGAMLATMLGGMGSALGIRIAASQGAGVLSEKPELFGRLLILMVLPGTQGIYGFVCVIIVIHRIGLLGGEVTVGPLAGLALLAVGLGTGLVLWRSAIYQGETSAAAISMVAKRPEQAGRSILLPALVEFYAALAFLVALLLIIFLTEPTLSLPTSIGGQG